MQSIFTLKFLWFEVLNTWRETNSSQRLLIQFVYINLLYEFTASNYAPSLQSKWINLHNLLRSQVSSLPLFILLLYWTPLPSWFLFNSCLCFQLITQTAAMNFEEYVACDNHVVNPYVPLYQNNLWTHFTFFLHIIMLYNPNSNVFFFEMNKDSFIEILWLWRNFTFMS